MLIKLYRGRKKYKFMSKLWAKAWAKRAYNIPALVRNSIKVSLYKIYGAKIGSFASIEPRLTRLVCSKIEVGDNVAIASDVHFAPHARIVIGNNVVISNGVKIYTGSHDIHSPNWPLISADVFINDYAWICADCIILPGVTIGEGAVVAAGSVVSRNVNPYSVVAGNPSKVIGGRRCKPAHNPTAFVALFESWLGTEG